jgi:hypothetical protein
LPLYKTHDAVAWWATPLEVASALARLMRMKQLDTRDWLEAAAIASRVTAGKYNLVI